MKLSPPRMLWLSLLLAIAILSFFVAQNSSSTTATTPPLETYLNLTPAQQQAILAADPDFAEISRSLTANLDQNRALLASLLENPAASDEQILAQVENVITAHDNLERHVARHVLAIRPHLSAEQQKQLMGLCAMGVREAEQFRWRGGRNRMSEAQPSTSTSTTERNTQSRRNGTGRYHGPPSAQ